MKNISLNNLYLFLNHIHDLIYFIKITVITHKVKSSSVNCFGSRFSLL